MDTVHFSRKDAEKIVDSAIAIADTLGMTGSVVIVDTNDNFIYGILNGYESPMTYAIAANNAALSGHIDAPFPGGCPIYTKKGVHIGGAGFSEQAGVVNKRIMSEAIEACGFLSYIPTTENIS